MRPSRRSRRDVAPTPEQLSEDIKSGARKDVRARVEKSVRTGGPYQTAILDTVLQENAAELGRLRGSLRTFAPDVIVGAERSGPFIADAATSGEPSLASKILRVPKGNLDAVMADMARRDRSANRQR